ncbi:DarT ssDNA thymidine ADP-ribosyltransferase family protein [Marinitoga litoralis]|uniref:DarT ssDNA thymidine ADP-ribosyltransferase family protein n=1 Tax=Marinitoga litoralis TaxID=570855 RepID=UPI00195FDAC7
MIHEGGGIIFEKFYYITPYENAIKIFKSGYIYSREYAIRKSYIEKDYSDRDVQNRRRYKKLPNKKMLYEYVPLYINPRNAMLYRYLKEKRNIVILEISNKILRIYDHYFSIKNASAEDAIFTKNIKDLELKKDMIFSKNWYGNKELKQIMQSEVLIYEKISVKYIDRVIVNSSKNFYSLRKFANVSYCTPYIEDIFFENALKKGEVA